MHKKLYRCLLSDNGASSPRTVSDWARGHWESGFPDCQPRPCLLKLTG